MAKFRYYNSKFAVADYSDIDPENVDTVNEAAIVVLSDEDGVKAVIHLAPGERIERIAD